MVIQTPDGSVTVEQAINELLGFARDDNERLKRLEARQEIIDKKLDELIRFTRSGTTELYDVDCSVKGI